MIKSLVPVVAVARVIVACGMGPRGSGALTRPRRPLPVAVDAIGEALAAADRRRRGGGVLLVVLQPAATALQPRLMIVRRPLRSGRSQPRALNLLRHSNERSRGGHANERREVNMTSSREGRDLPPAALRRHWQRPQAPNLAPAVPRAISLQRFTLPPTPRIPAFATRRGCTARWLPRPVATRSILRCAARRRPPRPPFVIGRGIA